jgi:hypothetical protein
MPKHHETWGIQFVHNGRSHGPDKRVQQITKNLMNKWAGL